MQSYQPRTRLYVDADSLRLGDILSLPPAQTHYLRSVLRAQPGQNVDVFNGRDGAFEAEITALTKASAHLMLKQRSAPQEVLPKIALAFALLKKERTQMVVEKATELGAARLIPMVTERTQGPAVKQWKPDKAKAHAIEACEQCGRTALPDIAPPTPFKQLLGAGGILLYADEMRAGAPTLKLPRAENAWQTLLIGPEGGWSAAEREALKACTHAAPISLGPRILRAETAAIAALTLLQLYSV